MAETNSTYRMMLREALSVDTGATVRVGNARVPVFGLDLRYLTALGEGIDTKGIDRLLAGLKELGNCVTVLETGRGFWVSGLGVNALGFIFMPSDLGISTVPDELWMQETIHAAEALPPLPPSDPQSPVGLQARVALAAIAARRAERELAETQEAVVDAKRAKVATAGRVQTLTARQAETLGYFEISKADLTELKRVFAASEVYLDDLEADFVNRKAAIRVLANATQTISIQLNRYRWAVEVFSSPEASAHKMEQVLFRLKSASDFNTKLASTQYHHDILAVADRVAAFANRHDLSGTMTRDEYRAFKKAQEAAKAEALRAVKAEIRATQREANTLQRKLTAAQNAKDEAAALLADVEVQRLRHGLAWREGKSAYRDAKKATRDATRRLNAAEAALVEIQSNLRMEKDERAAAYRFLWEARAALRVAENTA